MTLWGYVLALQFAGLVGLWGCLGGAVFWLLVVPIYRRRARGDATPIA